LALAVGASAVDTTNSAAPASIAGKRPRRELLLETGENETARRTTEGRGRTIKEHIADSRN